MTAEDRERERSDRIIAQNLASVNALGSGSKMQDTGGIFTILHIGDADAEFKFNGWNTKIHRPLAQTIEVRRGTNANIRIAIVRKIIAIIREYEPGDFMWDSKRLHREITLSARAADNDTLENFLMMEFFDEAGNAR